MANIAEIRRPLFILKSPAQILNQGMQFKNRGKNSSMIMIGAIVFLTILKMKNKYLNPSPIIILLNLAESTSLLIFGWA
ncbi:MAG: hypothetical protein ABIL15_07875 [candidate division WOR-3 bacterium]